MTKLEGMLGVNPVEACVSGVSMLGGSVTTCVIDE